jgi:hypothetical protein
MDLLMDQETSLVDAGCVASRRCDGGVAPTTTATPQQWTDGDGMVPTAAA